MHSSLFSKINFEKKKTATIVWIENRNYPLQIFGTHQIVHVEKRLFNFTIIFVFDFFLSALVVRVSTTMTTTHIYGIGHKIPKCMILFYAFMRFQLNAFNGTQRMRIQKKKKKKQRQWQQEHTFVNIKCKCSACVEHIKNLQYTNERRVESGREIMWLKNICSTLNWDDNSHSKKVRRSNALFYFICVLFCSVALCRSRYRFYRERTKTPF